MDFEERVAKELAEQSSKTSQKTDAASNRQAMLDREIVKFRDDLREALALLTRRNVPMVPIAHVERGVESILGKRHDKFWWSGCMGWGLAGYVAVNGVLVPSTGAFQIRADSRPTAELQRELAKLPRNFRGQIWTVVPGKLPVRGTTTLVQEPGDGEILRMLGNNSVQWDRLEGIKKRLSARLTPVDNFAPLRLIKEELQIRHFYGYYTTYSPAKEWLVEAVAKAINQVAP